MAGLEFLAAIANATEEGLKIAPAEAGSDGLGVEGAIVSPAGLLSSLSSAGAKMGEWNPPLHEEGGSCPVAWKDDEDVLAPGSARSSRKIRKEVVPGKPGSEWHVCDICDYKTQSLATIKTHIKNGCSRTQKPGIKMHFCDELNCTYKTKRASNLTQHTQNVHSLNVQWHRCTFPHCTFKAKQTGDLRRHRQQIHDLDVKWHYCREVGCGYKAKLKHSLTQHIKRRHGVRK
ncbi:hypothetical protein TrST_g10481 [Triparma strigata]|uniref:C2H2-type domain-containing protein n=1 Tax=Triparma strigata TaxID=1606541 RepID=A0A9W7ALB8_9STRA|nr:hypothetical protein TrST_g10481 [Triparma strigata]